MIIGIDLGTTNSLVAYYTEDGPKIIPNRLGKNLTPSVVSVDEEGQVYIGETAKERMLLHPESSAAVFKRSMGSEKVYELSGKKFLPEELSALVLKALKEDAECFLQEEVTEAVISVPAYFNDERRKATKRAGELAGLTVERIISEPTAAAIAYGLYQNRENGKFLVFDLGGGTFDVSILELFDSIIEVRAVAGDNFLGGEDFTKVIEQIFFDKHPEIEEESLTDKERRHITKQAENCKIGFSDNRYSKMICKIQDEIYEMELSMEEYEAKCDELLDKIRQPIKRSLADANVRLRDIDRVVLVGGATKLPFIRKFVGKLFHNLPDTSINPDETVALGAAVQGAMKERKDSIKEVILTDVCPFTLGTEVVIEKDNGRYEDGHFCPIIERNTTIPASRTERLFTVNDNQTQIRCKVLQGESRFASNNVYLGEICIKVPKAEAGKEAIDVTYTYDVNSILEVEIKVVSTGEITKQIIKTNATDMTEEEIRERMEALSYLKIHPRDKEENKLLLLRGERLYEESIGMERMQIEYALQEFEKALDTREDSVIEGARRDFREFLENFSE
ncbi:MAG TPA: molecular chaperone HscC [Lachnospiraceae bacterium]|nr:molecular chaperone HscC [Lachnospiraceae bacterium]